MSKSSKSLRVTKWNFLQWIYNILAGTIDEGLNIILGGSRNETISARLGRAMLSENKPRFYVIPVHWFVNKVLFFWQDDHCRDALDLADNVDDEVWTWYSKRSSI